MSKSTADRSALLVDLEAVFAANPDLNLSEVGADLSEGSALVERFADAGEGLVDMLRAYQRVERLVGEGQRELVFGLLERGVGSAIHVAAMPLRRFQADFVDLFGGDLERAAAIHGAAKARRSALVLAYVRARQGLEAHTRGATTVQGHGEG